MAWCHDSRNERSNDCYLPRRECLLAPEVQKHSTIVEAYCCEPGLREGSMPSAPRPPLIGHTTPLMCDAAAGADLFYRVAPLN